METTCFHFHVTDNYLVKNFPLKAGDDAVNVKWIFATEKDNDFQRLYASHHDIVVKALGKQVS